MGGGVSVTNDSFNRPISPSTAILPPPSPVGTHFPREGVSLRYMHEFLDVCCGGDRSLLAGLTTDDVCEQFVKTATEQQQCSYCQLLAAQGHPAVGLATVFVCHTRRSSFLDLIDALSHHFRDDTEDANVFVWVDVFSLCQHQLTLDQRWFRHIFGSAIQAMNCTVLVLAPWDEPLPLTRTWCLYELYLSALHKVRFEVAMTEAQHQSFIEDVSNGAPATLEKLLTQVDLENSECSRTEDKEMMFEAALGGVGFVGVNDAVGGLLRSWVQQVTTTALEKEHEEVRMFGLKNTLGQLYDQGGQAEIAEPLLAESFAQSKSLLGSRHPTTVSLMHNLALIYWRLGKFTLAEPLYAESFAHRKRLLGNQHPSTLDAQGSLASLYESLGQAQKAVAMLEDCLAKMRQVGGRGRVRCCPPVHSTS